MVLYPAAAAQVAQSGAVWTYDNIQIAATTNVAFVQEFSGDGATVAFTLGSDLGTNSKALMVFADQPFVEYSANGSFTTDTLRTKGSNITIGTGVASWGSATSSDLSQTALFKLETGEDYVVTYTVTAFSAGTVTAKIGGGVG